MYAVSETIQNIFHEVKTVLHGSCSNSSTLKGKIKKRLY